MNELVNIMTLFVIINKENEIYYGYVKSLVTLTKILSISGDSRNIKIMKGMSIVLSSILGNLMFDRYKELKGYGEIN